MFETAFASVRFGASMAFGRPFHLKSLNRIIEALQESIDEYGPAALGARGELLAAPMLDGRTRKAVQGRRLRAQAARAAERTPYYEQLFRRIDVDARRLRLSDALEVPITHKSPLRSNPDAFVCRNSRPDVRVTTTGTTGWPASISFSQRELNVIAALSAVGLLSRRLIQPDDIVHVATSPRALLGISGVSRASNAIGAPIHIAGLPGAEVTLALLAEQRRLSGKKSRVSVLVTYPSYLGTLVQAGFDSGYRSTDFRVERVVLMGEMASEGLRRRAQELFGPVTYVHDYGMTELAPFGGAQCSQGHLHFEPSAGLLEVIGLDTPVPTDPGQPGTIVATPFHPYRETTLLIRYDTEDVVQALPEALTCDLRGLPATSHLLGKRHFTVRHEEGWCFPRDVVEALESIDAIPLPARYGVKATSGGVDLEAVATRDQDSTRRRVVGELEERGIPVKGLHLVTDRRQLQGPRPVRADLHEGALSSGTPADPLLPARLHRRPRHRARV